MGGIYGDKLVGLKPIDKKSAIVAFSKGEHQEKVNTTNLCSDNPFSTRRLPREFHGDILTGMRFGKLKVVGFFGKFNRINERSRNEKNRTSYWVTRCDCGRYQLVRRKPLVGGTVTMCEVCKRNEYIRNNAK